MKPVQSDPEQWSENVRVDVGDITGKSGRIVLAVFAAVVVWALVIPIDSAVIAPGTMISEGRNQVLQHRAGGLIQRILVREGDLVEAGSVILELEPDIDRARLTRLRARHAALDAQRRRLEAEKANATGGQVLSAAFMELRGNLVDPGVTGAIGASLRGAAGGTLEETLDNEQQRELETGRRALQAEITALGRRAGSLREQREGALRRHRGLARRAELARDQHIAALSLLKAGHISRQQTFELESRLLESEAAYTDNQASVNSLGNSIAEIEAQIRQVRMSDHRTTSQQLTQVVAELAEISDELSAAELALTQTSLRAPVTGTLVHFLTNTVGGVIAPGDKIGEIVPIDGPKQMQARVPLKDIASIALNQPVEIQISSFNPRLDDKLDGRVSYVAADSTLEERTGQRYFEVRIDLDPDMPPELAGRLHAGLAGDAYLKGPSRTFAAYLFQPFLDGLSRSFREVN